MAIQNNRHFCEIATRFSAELIQYVTEMCEKISNILSIKVNEVTSYDVRI